MSRLVRRYSWKFLGLVLLIAALSLVAPSGWFYFLPGKSVANNDHLRLFPAPAHLQDIGATVAFNPATPAPAPYLPAENSFVELAPAFEVPAMPAEKTEPTPARAASLESPATGLEEFATPQQVAPTGPVVAEQIDLDPSLSEQPTRIAPKVELELSTPEPEVAPVPTEPSTPSPTVPTEPRTLPDAADLPNQSTIKPEVQPDVPPPPANASAGAWPYPTALIAQLRELADAEPSAAIWAQQAIAELEALAMVERLDAPAVGTALDNLHKLAEQAKGIAAPLPSDNQRSQVLRAGYAIVRRIAVWQVTHVAAYEAANRQIASPDTAAWNQCLTTLEQKLLTLPGGAPWTNYLRLEQARQKIASADTSAADRRALARDILRRLNSTQFDATQGDFAECEVFFDLTKHLKAWADEPTDLVRVLQSIEDYERQELTAESSALANAYQQVRWSPDKNIAELGETLNMYYRNANVRVAISAELVNRMLPKEARQLEYVQDTIQGAYVEGNSEASTRLRLVLLPDRLRWRMGLEAKGEVASDTSSTKGPATFYQNGVSHYRVRKMLLVDRRGVRMFNAEAEAQANSNLLDYETSYDGIPLLGSLARAIARSQYDAAQDSARLEVEGKIQGRATSRIDQAVAEQLQKGKANFQTKLLEPMRKLQLEPTAVDMETTHERLIARYRLAGHEQLSSHTPRPQAPGDSLLSVQVHETAFNNILDRLNLAGRRLELRELYKEVTSIFTKDAPPPPEDLPEDVYVTFMQTDPVRVDCDEGRVRLTIRIEALEHGKSKWQNFTVRGYYAPYSDQLDANLARDGVIELIGEKLRFGDQIALRGIFSRVLSRNRKLSLVNKQIAMSPELQDQQVTQLVIHDGWMGVALGPKHPQRQTLGPNMSSRPGEAKRSR
ncbi:hypothetical protein NA78x_000317 [Anatilimnocola sp. NA78]|uniref:hypothetical protein n=1 Tax=Anatilimnocola sp. NA78 TaxID=3415683 RepID=UPI003CE56F1A